MIYWVMTPCILVGYNASEEPAASTFRVEVQMIKPAIFYHIRQIDRQTDRAIYIYI